ncbi:MAG: DNA (cytosine-5-)-methyltransferase [Magnetococcales bacterium]|nr:DNA (cytosine-5-)-methyltransferase [Magnetococcales bacterium]
MIKFADLFAGTGGIRLAFEQACSELGIDNKCVFSSEIDKKASLSYEANFGENPLSDIVKVTDFPDFEFLLAGFPCQSFSYAGKHKGFADIRGTLFFDVVRILEQKKPKYFLLENVRGLKSHDKGRTFKTIIKNLNRLGYSTKYLLLNSSNFNVPQNRVRIYIVGILDNRIKIKLKSNLGAADTHIFRAKLDKRKKPISDNGFTKPVVVKDILQTNVDKKFFCNKDFTNRLSRIVGENFEELHGYRLIDHRNGKSIHSWELGVKGECTHEEIEFMNLLIANRRKKKFGTHQDGKSLTEEQIKTFFHSDNFDVVVSGLLDKGYLSCNDGRYNPFCGNMSFEVFKFLDPHGISITLTSSDCNRLGIVQDNQPRRITPRECARLQGYPDSYILIDDDTAVYKQMGNAVSVPVVKSVLHDMLVHNYR